MKLASLLVSDYMTVSPITVEPEDALMRALEIMRLRGVRRIPIAVGGMLVGLVAEGDLKRAQPSTLSDSQEDFNRVMEDDADLADHDLEADHHDRGHARCSTPPDHAQHQVRRAAGRRRRARGRDPDRQRPDARLVDAMREAKGPRAERLVAGRERRRRRRDLVRRLRPALRRRRSAATSCERPDRRDARAAAPLAGRDACSTSAAATASSPARWSRPDTP